MTARRRQLKWVLGVALGVLILDQGSKTVVRSMIEKGTPFVDEVFFRFVHHSNPGLVGGMFSEWPVVKYVALTAAIGILVYLFRTLNPASKWQSLAYGLILGGALGNLTDRVLYRAVTDFLQFHFYFIPFDFPWKYYPAFNLADSAIFVGVGTLVLTWNVGAQDNATRPA